VTDTEKAKHNLRIAATERMLGREVGSDRLIRLGVDALLADLDTPSLRVLAGLRRSEEPEARELFERVLDELDLTVELPADKSQARWNLVREWAALIAEGGLDPLRGANLIWLEATEELDYPRALQPFVEAAINGDDWNEAWSTTLDDIRAGIVDAARELLNGPPEP
jgi:hypothetical protein